MEELMKWRSVFSTMVLVGGIGVTPGVAQVKLGDLVAIAGYDWMMGDWVATGDNGQKAQFIFDWALDKRVLLNRLQMGDFQYQGMITLAPSGQEAVEWGVDNRGGTWRGTWGADLDGIVRKVEHLGTDGQVHKGEIVIARVGADAITIAMYAADSSGSRSAEPMSKLTYKRQQAQGLPVRATHASPLPRVGDPNATPARAGAETSGRSTDYERLGDIVASAGYEWLIGKWSGNENNRTYAVEYQPILDKHAAFVDRKIGDFKYLGLIMYVASRQEVAEFGVDTLGRLWKIVWEQAGGDLVNKGEITKPDGPAQKLRHVFTKIDNDTFKVKLYGVGTDGSRESEPREQVTFKREKQTPRPL
jgi:hypothetical protein